MDQSATEASQLEQNFGIWHAPLGIDSLTWDAATHGILGLPDRGPSAGLGQIVSRMHPADQGFADKTLARSLDGSAPLDVSFRVVRVGGEVRRVLMRGSVAVGAMREYPGHSGVCLDITDLGQTAADAPCDCTHAEPQAHGGADRDQRVESPQLCMASSWEVLERAARLATVGELLQGVAHDVHSSLNVVINAAQLVLDGESRDRYGGMVIEEGHRLVGIVNSFVDFARCDASRPVATGLPELVQRCVQLVGRSLQMHGIGLHVENAEGLPEVVAHPHRLQQVLISLLVNARDSLLEHRDNLAEKPRIEVHTEHGVDPAYPVVLVVSDNGPGVPDGVIDRMFEPLFTTRGARGGTGLGVSVSRRIVEDCGGRFCFEKTTTGWTQFRAALPRPWSA